jgi:hypothetical protein
VSITSSKGESNNRTAPHRTPQNINEPAMPGQITPYTTDPAPEELLFVVVELAALLFLAILWLKTRRGDEGEEEEEERGEEE